MTDAFPNLVSIVIGNWNYARYVGRAIESALAQNRTGVEVIVVDDGSTDDSVAVIKRFGDAVRLIEKPNGGQGSVYNAGLDVAAGDIVMFLDADDVLLPHAASAVVDAFGSRPDAAHVHFRMQFVGADDELLQRWDPPLHHRLTEGDLRQYVARFRGYTTSAGSGHAYPRWVLDRVVPVPEAVYPHGADAYLVNAAPLWGPVVAVHETCALYRLHGENRYLRGGHVDLALIRRKLTQVRDGHAHLKRVADAAGIDAYPAEFDDLRDVLVLTWRMVSLRLDPDTHPFPADRRWALASIGAVTALRRPGTPVPRRVVAACWFLAMAIATRRAAGRLTAALLYPEQRGRLGALITRLRWRKTPSRAGTQAHDSGPVDRTAT